MEEKIFKLFDEIVNLNKEINEEQISEKSLQNLNF